MIRRPPRSTLFPYTDALPISRDQRGRRPRGRERDPAAAIVRAAVQGDRKSTRLNSSHLVISHAVFCLKQEDVVMNLRAHAQEKIVRCLELFALAFSDQIMRLD